MELEINRNKFIAKQIDFLVSELIADNEALRRDNILLAKNQSGEITQERRTPISALGLSIRACSCLRRGGVKYMEQLVKIDSEDLKKFRNLGRKTLAEIVNRVQAFLSNTSDRVTK